MRIPETSAGPARLSAGGVAVTPVQQTTEGPGGLLSRHNRAYKRLADLIISISGLFLLMPVAAGAAVAIMICSPGPWWHVQWRMGRGGVPFRMWKLRTMYPDADARLAAHLERNAGAREEWSEEFKLTKDPRLIPVVGRVLRRSSLDEYPQFLNVIRGDMSVVGPRPLPTYHLEAFSPDFRVLRQQVRPGITGMWQVMSRGRGAIETQEAMDRHYIQTWSMWTDMSLVAKTILAVVTGRGAR